MKIHISRKGDTLLSIATKYNVDPVKLVASNSILQSGDEVEPGVKVKIPIPPKPIELPPAQFLHQHTVHQGDTLWKLSKTWNVPLKVLISVNPQLKNPNVLLSGEIVNIPKLTDTITQVSMVAESISQASRAEEPQGQRVVQVEQEPVVSVAQENWNQASTQDSEAETYPPSNYVTFDGHVPAVNYNYVAEEQPRMMPTNTEWGTNYPVYETNVTNPYETYAIDPRTNIPALPYDDSALVAQEQPLDTDQIKAQIHQILNSAVKEQDGLSDEAAPAAFKQKSSKPSEKSKLKARTSSTTSKKSSKSSSTSSRSTAKKGRPWIKM
ncbi:LysM peptidoglycan-binding domain-containing protein [Paenibacillus sp. N1-5-1-14]|uniref:LysM peptidoglycan-binding domain-containing protein n=1 Tax=Paenibacillus radicibacter TaxID=2972488 RepID=UPI0021599D42|nr:LysM peptidoglycan-binding domain-containing protein [Paenibacillus radicibacter]MCR8644122.1 LysM peptidoglycan-binding domain-containing protein [Paenibacillus radicibacter]